MMASPSGAYSPGSSSLQNSVSGSGSGSDGDTQQQQQDQIMDQRKRKRMLSNRESARRSRMKKQQHVDGLIAIADQLKKDNNEIKNSIGITTQLYLNVESENAILRTQMAELSNRLQSLNEIIGYINSSSYLFDESQETHFNDCGAFVDTWNSLSPLNQPIMASLDMLMY